MDHAEILIIAGHGILCGKAQQRHTAVSVDHDVHVLVQNPTVMVKLFSVHTVPPYFRLKHSWFILYRRINFVNNIL